jgi:hypothetical protein
LIDITPQKNQITKKPNHKKKFFSLIDITQKKPNHKKMSSNFGQLGRDLIGKTLSIAGKTAIDQDCNATFNSIKATEIKLNDVIGPSNCSCLSLKYIADENIPAYRLLKVSDTTDFRVKQIKAADSSSIYSIGISTKAANAGEVVDVCTCGVFKIQLETGATVNRGDKLSKSGNEDGKAVPSSNCVFGMSLQTISTQTVDWTGNGGNSDFDNQTIEFPIITNVDRLCFDNSSANAHLHEDYGSTVITVDLWDVDAAKWINIYKTVLTPGNSDIEFSTLNPLSFSLIHQVNKIRFRSSPPQDQSFHDFSNLQLKFNCESPIILGAYTKSHLPD